MAVTIVAISGKSGCGNTSVSRLLSERLRVRLINYTFRAMAIEKGVDFPGMLALANADFAYDRALDARQVELARERDCVIGSRLAIWLLPDATLKLYLAASPEARAERIRKREGGELADVLAFTKDRDARDHARYRTIYGIDNDDLSCADLVVN
ncbi:MAG: cytidylate kinase family protein, partial [Spirochaetaceae bacterium]|nr:cytidylate kinase family protein [Spirochaetaceae bacterium]